MISVLGIGLFIILVIYHFHHQSLLFILLDAIFIAIGMILVWHWTVPLGERLTLWIPYPSITAESTLALYSSSALGSIPFAFIRACASFIIAAGVWAVRAFVLMWLRPLETRGHRQLVIGSLFGLVVAWGSVAILLAWVSLINFEAIQSTFASQPLLRWMVIKTPGVASHVLALWFQGPVPFQ
ncbi:MAG: hypothetical protein Q4A67_04795 [Aerococcus sp.]|nr:hypothetical protein [Aerococcus sp.]